MKKVSILLLISFLFLTAAASANGIKSDEDYTGKRWYSVTDTESSKFYDFNEHYKITTTFSTVYEKNSTTSLKEYVLEYQKDNLISIRPRITFQISGKTWEVFSQEESYVDNNGAVQCRWVLPASLLNALLSAKKDITVRFFYNTDDGDHSKDYTIPYRVVKSVQTMYLQKH